MTDSWAAQSFLAGAAVFACAGACLLCAAAGAWLYRQGQRNESPIPRLRLPRILTSDRRKDPDDLDPDRITMPPDRA